MILLQQLHPVAPDNRVNVAVQTNANLLNSRVRNKSGSIK